MRRWKQRLSDLVLPGGARRAEAAPPPLPEAALPDPPTVAPTQEQIRARAYEIYRRRIEQGLPGDALSDWLQAERDLTGRPPERAPQVEIKVRPPSRDARPLSA